MSGGDSSGVKCGENVKLSENLEVLSFEEFIDVDSKVPLSVAEALPDEILVKIFQMLPFVTKIAVLPKVCERWGIVSRDFAVFPTVFDFRDIPPKVLHKSMNTIFDIMETHEIIRPTKLILPDITEKDFRENVIIAKILVRGGNLGLWKCLTKLSAGEIDIHEQVLRKFISSLNCEIFTELSINKMTILKIYSICKYLKNLKRLVVWNTVDILTISYLASYIGNLKYLKELRLQLQTDVQVADINRILQKRREQLELLTLWLPYIYSIDRGFIKSLGLCRQLTYLDIWLPEAMEYDDLRTALASMTQLEQLILHAPRLTGRRRIRRENTLFTEFRNLRHVYLCTDDLYDKDVTDLCMNCGHCLETLNLEECNELTDTTVTSIITYCDRLVALKLDGCKKIDKEELVKNLAKKLDHDLPQLVVLTLSTMHDYNICGISRCGIFINCEAASSSALHKILGPNCYHRKRLIDKLTFL